MLTGKSEPRFISFFVKSSTLHVVTVKLFRSIKQNRCFLYIALNTTYLFLIKKCFSGCFAAAPPSASA